MYGTCASARIRPENRDQLVKVLEAQNQGSQIPGFMHGFVLLPEGRDDEVMMFAVFEDRDSYMKNADDPAQDERYREYRALMESDPEWTDGEIAGI